MNYNINRREISVAAELCFLVTSLSFSLLSQSRLLIEEYKAYTDKTEKSFECISILVWIQIFWAWPSVMEKVNWEVGSLVWSEGVRSHTPSRGKGIKHCTESQYPGPCTGPSCAQASTQRHKSALCASYWSPLISSASFEEGCRMPVIPPPSRPSAHAESALGFSLKCA